MNGIDVRAATAADQASVMDIITLAFAADPPTRYWWPLASDYMHWWPRFGAAMGARAFACGSVTVTSDLSGAAIWLPPGIEPDGEAIAALDMPGTPEEEEVSNALREAMAAYHPPEPHWYLWLIGVDPRVRGRGVGSALLRHTLDRCDAEGQTAYLESSTPQNIPLYERHGFEVIGRIQVRDMPPLTPMIRLPR
jgi:ribosomal protein S18 acetylase RimI-like enzyme